MDDIIIEVLATVPGEMHKTVAEYKYIFSQIHKYLFIKVMEEDSDHYSTWVAEGFRIRNSGQPVIIPKGKGNTIASALTNLLETMNDSINQLLAEHTDQEIEWILL